VHGFTLAGASRALHTNAVQQRTAPQHSITSASGFGGFGAAANCRNKRFLEQKFRLAVGSLLKGWEPKVA